MDANRNPISQHPHTPAIGDTPLIVKNEKRDGRLKKIEKVTTYTGFVLMCTVILIGIWGLCHRFVQQYFCKDTVDLDREPFFQYGTGQHYLEDYLACKPLGNDAYWLSIPAAVAISCVIYAVVATALFVISVMNRDYTEKLGNMMPKWKRSYLGALDALSFIFVAAVLLTLIGYSHAVIAPYGLF